jgi:acyl-CoA reductase-like NAD-dependent aldehyde dehydrogenase
MCDNLAFSICLYSGQMCTAPQNIFVPKDGFKAGDEMISYDKFVETLIASVNALVNNPKAAPVVLGAIQNEMTCNRVEQATKELPAKLLLASQPVPNPEFPKARTASPAIFEVASKDVAVYSSEMFGPIMFIIPTADTNQSIERARSLAQKHGAISCAAYTTNAEIMQRIADEMADTATAVSFNLTGQVYVNQNAAFSDFHLSGGNPAGNASFTNTEFVAKRFTTVGIRVQ